MPLYYRLALLSVLINISTNLVIKITYIIYYMQGKQDYQPQLFSYVSTESLIPKNHILRRIDKVCDLSFVRALTKSHYCFDNGRPSIDPELFFRMLVISYIFGINSDRRLCEEIGYNLAYRWYCRLNLEDKVPDHSSLTNIRDRYGEVIFEQFFDEVVNICRKHGLVKGGSIITDGTLIAANASLDSMAEKIQGVDDSLEPSKQSTESKVTFTPKKLSNKTHYSKTDPDSSLAVKIGSTKGLKYKIHTSIDASSRIILDNKATTGSIHETTIYLERLNYIRNKYNLKISEAIADRGYGSVENIQTLQSNKITSYIPLFSSRSGKGNNLDSQGYIYNKKHNHYTCLNNKHLSPIRNKNKDCQYVHYRSRSVYCKNCKLSKSCTLGKLSKSHVRYIVASKHKDFFEKEQKRMEQKIFYSKSRERMWKIEGINAEAKQYHNLARAKYRGLKKVQIQAYMTGIVQNLKRLTNALELSHNRTLSGNLDNILKKLQNHLSKIRILAFDLFFRKFAETYPI